MIIIKYFHLSKCFSVHKRFSQLDTEAVRRDKNAKLPMRLILQLPELHVRDWLLYQWLWEANNSHRMIWTTPYFLLSLQVNPFRDRICKVFSSSGDGALTFEDFLDMMSVFSEAVSAYMILSNNWSVSS